MKNTNQVNIENSNEFEIAAFLRLLMRKWYFVLAGIIIGVLITSVFVRYSIPVYQSSSQVLLNVNRQQDPLAELTGQMGGGSYRNRYMNTDDNDILVLKSRNVSDLANENMPLQIRWYVKGRIRGVLEYDAANAPIKVEIDSSVFDLYKTKFSVELINEQSYTLVYTIDDSEKVLKSIPFGKSNKLGMTLSLIKVFDAEHFFEIIPQESSTKDLRASMDIKSVKDGGSVYEIQIKHPVPEYAERYANVILESFVEYSKIEKKQSYKEALTFVDERLNELGDSLKKVEKMLTDFRVSNKIISPTSKGEFIFQQYYEFVEKSISLENQLSYLKDVDKYLKGEKNLLDLKMPVIVGIENETLLGIMTELRTLYTDIAEKGVSIKLTEESPLWERYQVIIQKNQQSLEEVLIQLVKDVESKLNDTNKRKAQLESELGIFPELEQRLANIQRKYETNQKLYQFLSEKKLDIGIKGSTVLADHKIIQKSSKPIQISPNNTRIIALGVSLGTIIPLLILFGFFYFDNHLKDISEIEKVSQVSFLGVIPKFKEAKVGEIFESPKSLIAESFRNIKSKMRYSLADAKKNQIILLTSTRPGEGKTFCSENLASILAYGGDSVVVIGTDMRRPQLFKDLNVKNEKGLSDYLSGQASQEEVLLKTAYPNLSVIVSGAIPPNPTELLDSKAMSSLLINLRKNFDYIILDTTPLDIVADANVLLNYADLVLVVLRQNVTEKKSLEILNQKWQTGQLPKNSVIILNDFDEKKSYSGYQSYGYGYGYKQAYV